jgi:hypothetical protein
MLSMTDPSGHVTSYGYDDDGNCTSVTDGNGVTTNFTYDASPTSAVSRETVAKNLFFSRLGLKNGGFFEFFAKNPPVRAF